MQTPKATLNGLVGVGLAPHPNLGAGTTPPPIAISRLPWSWADLQLRVKSI